MAQLLGGYTQGKQLLRNLDCPFYLQKNITESFQATCVEERQRKKRLSRTMMPVNKQRTVKPLAEQEKQTFSRQRGEQLRTHSMKKVMAQPACVDTRKGDKQLLEKSGLVPFLLQKNDYRIVPGYLRRRKAEKEKETVKPLAEQEKQNILQAMSQVEKDIALFEEHKYIYVGREDASDEQQLQRTPLPPIRPKKTKLTPAPQVTQPTKRKLSRPTTYHLS
uniref:Enkurin domain-containing protein n=1 Tax=Maylandia zebra TaxID=106582 RepID=A0A3P9DFR9_9CICH